MFSSIDYESIMNMLTLRYNPNRNPIREPYQVKILFLQTRSNIESNIIDIVKNDLFTKARKFKV